MSELYQLWINAKEAERLATESRRVIEDALVSVFSIPENLEGTEKRDDDGFVIKIIGRMNRKVNAELLQEVANENGLAEYLSTLFRWKPEISASAWKAVDKSITDVFAVAITTEPGRPSFTIEKKEN